MRWDVAGLGNALMDALVVVPNAESLLDELGLVRGTMHLVQHEAWHAAYERVKGHGVALESGGSCSNTIATLGRLGARAVYCGQVGADTLGEVYAERMMDACGAHRLHVNDELPTGKCLAIVSAEDAERTMLTDLGAAVALPSLGAYAEDLASSRVAHFEGYTMLDGPMLPVVEEAMKVAKASGALVSIDAADPFVVVTIRERLWHYLATYADIVFLNAEEARALTGEAPEDAAEIIARDAKLATVIVKLGSRGSIVVHNGERYEIGVTPVHALDTTGAGDAYAGGYLYGVVHGWDPARCGTLASAVAAATVSQIGAVVKDGTKLRALADQIGA